MYCTKCRLEIQEGAETVCPLCNMPLEEDSAEQQAAVPDVSAEDLKLRELITDIEGSVKQSLGVDEKSAQRNGQEVLFDPGSTTEEELQVPPEPGAAAVSPAAAGSDSDYEKTRAAMERALAGIEQQQLPAKIPPRRSSSKNAAAVLLVIGVVAAGIAAGYFFSVKEPQPRATAVPEKETLSQVPIAATPPAMSRPVTPPQPEKPVTAESTPPARNLQNRYKNSRLPQLHNLRSRSPLLPYRLRRPMNSRPLPPRYRDLRLPRLSKKLRSRRQSPLRRCRRPVLQAVSIASMWGPLN